MIRIRRAGERGHFDHGWLDTSHTFSFGQYFDPRFEGFRSLRVINEDRVQPGQGFGTHGHRDMEILSYVLEGTLAHKDSLGTGSEIVPGDVQYMSAGTGVRHSEFNASDSDPLHFLQIWIVPDAAGYAPRYGQKHFKETEKRGRLRLVASPTGEEASLAIRQDVRVYASILERGESVSLNLAEGRFGWVQVARGSLEIGAQRLEAGDGLAISEERELELSAPDGMAELLAFDLA